LIITSKITDSHNYCRISHLTLTVLLHYRAKFKKSKTTAELSNGPAYSVYLQCWCIAAKCLIY